jgi:serine/threonine-protein kinase haspin
LGISGWDELLQGTTSVVKIAEASYAQVYRITASTGYSIIKIVQLKVADDPESIDCETASPVELVISEMKIMNEMTEVPGFVAFKGAHLIQGIPSKQIERARSNFSAQRAKDGEEPSLFPDSSDYTENSIFLAIELGDAGDVLETFPITDRHQFWSILLGVIMALSRAETVAEFEASLSLIHEYIKAEKRTAPGSPRE